jgi:hypothetical protein
MTKGRARRQPMTFINGIDQLATPAANPYYPKDEGGLAPRHKR